MEDGWRTEMLQPSFFIQIFHVDSRHIAMQLDIFHLNPKINF